MSTRFKHLVIIIAAIGGAAHCRAAAMIPPLDEKISYTVVVIDSTAKVPLELARVVLRRGDAFIAGAITRANGQATFKDILPGRYALNVHSVSYHDVAIPLEISATHIIDTVFLSEVGLQDISYTGAHVGTINTIDLNSGNQLFESETYHAPPAARMTDLLQQNVAGAARAPTGEVHVRGQHGEFTYYIDGVPVPLGVFGGLNEVVDPKVIDHATFLTGGFPAEYGGQIAAVVELQNRVPAGRFHLDATTYVGSYFVPNGTSPFSPGSAVPQGASSSVAGDTLGARIGPFRALNSNGQSLSLSDHAGNFGFFLSGSRQETDRRIDPPVANLYHDHGFDYFLYGKFDYLLSDVDYLTCNLNFGRTATEIPFDPAKTGLLDDNQRTTNAFQTLSYFRTLSSAIDHESNFFAGLFVREGGLVFTPGLQDAPTFTFAGDTTTMYNLAEDRSFTTTGIRVKYDKRLSHELQFATGLSFSRTGGAENFSSRDSAGNAGPSIVTNFTGSDFGVFAQTEWHPFEWTRIDAGVRYDQHIAPDVPLQNQVSPRIRWNFLIDEFNSAYVYFGRLFMPTNIEGLRTIATNVVASAAGTLAEKDNFYEATFVHSFPFGVTSKASAFYKSSTPGVDDQTIGSSAIKTPVNIEHVYTTGVELALSYSDPRSAFSGRVNASLIHAYGSGAITGGFLSIGDAGAATDLDHDQRLSMAATVNYQPANWFVSLTGLYGSGLTNGNPSSSMFGTGLFDFNQAAHTTPSWIINASAGYTFNLANGSSIEPSFYISNLFDHDHLIKGTFFSGASWEERRNVVMKVAYHI